MTEDRKRTRFTVASATIRPAVLDGFVLTIAAFVSYVLAAHGLAQIHSVSDADDKLGGMCAVIAAVFVCRFARHESVTAAYIRFVATLVSFVLCLAYLLILPVHPLGMALLVGLGTVFLKLIGRDKDVITAGVTTAVVMVVADLSPEPWQQPILRLVDTMVGIAVGLAAVWAMRGPLRQPTDTES
jgi:uncharacterized membrane protein YgaE (UPF0421/DUF939 family)